MSNLRFVSVPTINLLTLSPVQAPSSGYVGEAIIPFDIVAQNAQGTVNLNATGLPSGLSIIVLSATSFRVTGTYNAAGTFNTVLTAIDTANGHTATRSFTTVVQAAPVGIVVAAGQVLPFGSLTLANESGIAPEISGSVLANAVINTQDGGAVTTWQMSPTTALVTRKPGSPALTPGTDFALDCTFTGQDGSFVNRVITAHVENVAGRSVGTNIELSNAHVAWNTSGTNLYLRGVVFGDMAQPLSNKSFTAPSYVTKHTNQVVMPEIAKWWCSLINYVTFSWIDFHWEGGLLDDNRSQTGRRMDRCNNIKWEYCIFRGKEAFDPLADTGGSSTFQTSLGNGIQSYQGGLNWSVKNCRFKNNWLCIWTANAPVGGVLEFHDNWFGPNAASCLFIGLSSTNHVSVSTLRNYFGTAVAQKGDFPAKSHTDFTFFAVSERGAAGWAVKNFVFNQNICNREVAKGVPKGLYIYGFGFQDPSAINNFTPITSSIEDPQILDNLIITDSYQGLDCAFFSGENGIVAGNTIMNWDPDNLSQGGPFFGFNGFDHPPNDPGSVAGKVKCCGNIIPRTFPSVLPRGMQVIGANTNFVTGDNGRAFPNRWADIFTNGATLRPTNRAEALTCAIPAPGSTLAALNPRPGAISGHHTFPTAALSSAGASMIDTNGDHWLNP